MNYSTSFQRRIPAKKVTKKLFTEEKPACPNKLHSDQFWVIFKSLQIQIKKNK